jgi:preprotein translocase subunit SecD
MGAVRLMRTLAPLAIVAGLAAACGNHSSSGPDTGPAVSGTLQLRPVSARYAQDTSQGQEQLGPQTPKDLVDTMKGYDCSSQPTQLQGMLLECDAASDVFLLKTPLVTGGVASAKPLQIGQGEQWYVKLTFDKDAAATLSQAADNMPGTELAVVVQGQVLTALVVDSSMKDGHIGITGDFDRQRATSLAHQLTGA